MILLQTSAIVNYRPKNPFAHRNFTVCLIIVFKLC